MQKRVAELDALTSNSDFWNNPKNAQKILKERSRIEYLLKKHRNLETQIEEGLLLLEMAEKENDTSTIEEVRAGIETLEKDVENYEIDILLSGSDDRSNAIMSINAGAGGVDAMDWAEMLMRMYIRWCDKRGFDAKIVDIREGEEAGIDSATILIQGEYAFGLLKGESGVHRLVRISPFDANKRRHTSFAAVFVIPEIEDDVQIDIKDEELRIDLFRAGGKGGQHVNKTESAVRITHIPTGITVVCQNERSQHRNKEIAMKILRSKLYELKMNERKEAFDSQYSSQKKKIEWGSQIRSYVLAPYQLVKDLRTNEETGAVQAVLDGDIDRFIKAYLLSTGRGEKFLF